VNTWLQHFQETSEYGKRNVVFRTRCGIGVRMPNGSTVSHFLGGPIHYREGNEWKPITLKHKNGKFEGVDFEWKESAVFYKGRPLFQPRSITFEGKKYPLAFSLKDSRLIADVPGIGIYEIVMTENGVREIFTIPEPLEGELSFQVESREKPSELKKGMRRITGSDLEGDVYQLTKDMAYPMEIDPDVYEDQADFSMQSTVADYGVSRVYMSGPPSEGAHLYSGQHFEVGFYTNYRSLVKFNTAGLPNGDRITKVNAVFTCSFNPTITREGADFDVVIKKHSWRWQDPTTQANKQAAWLDCLNAPTDGIWKNTADVTLGVQYDSDNLDGLWVDRKSYTYYSIISSRTLAATTAVFHEYLLVGGLLNPTPAYRPFLRVAHEPSGNYVLFS